MGTTSETIVWGRPGFVDPFTLCVFRQVRDGEEEHYVGIPTLAESIAGNGLMNPLAVCVWGEQQLKEYVEIVTRIFNGDSGSTMEKCKPDSNGNYWVLVAGHRRLHALRHLYERGSDAYRESFPERTSRECFYSQFGGDLSNPMPGFVQAMVYFGISPERGITLQLEENINRSDISITTQAKAIKGFYDLMTDKAGGGELTVAEFARTTQISEHVVRDALRFCELPKSIRYAVELRRFKWGCAIELTHIQRLLRERPKADGTMRDADEIERTLMSLAASEAASKNLEAFRRFLSSWIEEILGQQVLFEDELVLSPEEIAKNLLGPKMWRGLDEMGLFLQKVCFALENGWIVGGELVPFHRPEARRALAAMLKQQEALLLLLRTVLKCNQGRLDELCAKNTIAAQLIALLAGDD